MKRTAKSKIWKTRGGKKIPISEMTDSHLLNTIRFLQRAHQEAISAGYDVLGMLHGEMAVESVEQELHRLQEDGPASIAPLYEDLVREALRRRLKRR